MNGELGIAPIPYEPMYAFMPQEDPGIGLEYYPISYPAQEDPGIGLEYMPPDTGQDWKGSLWDFLKGTAKAGISAYTRYLTKPSDPKTLLSQYPEQEDPPIGLVPNWQMATPYPRKDSGSIPSFPVISAGGGVSPTILLIGVGALAFFFFMKGK